MGRTKKRSAGRKPVWQTRRGGRQPGARGPEAKDGFSELERAYLKVHRNAKGLTNQALFRIKCDYLIPAASGHVISGRNAKTVGARVVVEAANMPVDYEAMKIFEQRGIEIIPDTYANAGGVIASNIEYRQALGGAKYTREMTLAEVRNRFDAMLATMEPLMKKGRSMLEACTDVALKRVYDTMVQRSLL